MRSLLATQSKPNSDPAGPEPAANAVSSQPFQSLAWDFTGPITENIGIWTEWYSTQQTNAVGNAFGPVDNDEYDVKMVFNPGGSGNIIGFGMNNQGRTAPFFGAFGSGVASSQGNTVNVTGYAWLQDRAAFALAVIPGQTENNAGYDYQRMNWGFTGAVLPMNNDAMWLMVVGAYMVGNDMSPIGNVPGVSALRTGAGAGVNYAAADLGDAQRLLVDIRFGALDRGHFSFASATATSWRLFYDGTYGLLFNVGKRMTYSYTAANGTVYDIPNDLSVGVGFVFRQAMNFAWELQASNSQSLRLGTNWRNGWSWQLRWHYLY
jgi:hypothetical protein